MPNKQNKLKSFYDNFTNYAEKVKTIVPDAMKVQKARQDRRNMNNRIYKEQMGK